MSIQYTVPGFEPTTLFSTSYSQKVEHTGFEPSVTGWKAQMNPPGSWALAQHCVYIWCKTSVTIKRVLISILCYS